MKLLATTPRGDDPEGWKEEEPSLREVLTHASWDGPVWLTETGWVTTRLDESRQADHYRKFLSLWTAPDLESPWLEKVFFYELQDDRNPNVPNYGILRVSGREKPAYRVLREFIASREPPGDDDGDGEIEDENPRRPVSEKPRAPVL